MISLRMWQRIRAYVDEKVRDAYMAENHSDTACPCCKRWGWQGAKRTWKKIDEVSSRMICEECGAEAIFNFVIAPVAILMGWHPPITVSKAIDRGEILDEDSFFLVWNPDCSRTPAVRHSHEHAASKIAFEMAGKHNKGEVFYVLEARRAYQSQGNVQQFELEVRRGRRWNNNWLAHRKKKGWPINTKIAR